MLPRTQRHAESNVALRGCPGDANNDCSRIRAATRSDYGFLCICVGQVALLVKQSNPSQPSCRLNAPQIQIFALCSWLGCPIRSHCNDIPFNGQTHPTRRTLSVGIRAPSNREPPQERRKTLSLVLSQFCPLSRHESKGCKMPLCCPATQTNWRQVFWSTHFSCPCTFRGMGSRPLQWELLTKSDAWTEDGHAMTKADTFIHSNT